MTTIQWNAFQKFREEYRELCFSWNKNEKELFVLQKEAADLKKVPPYKLDTAVVYNQVYDSITQNDEIKLIVIGDNPGKEEQMAEKRSYLVGQAGRIAQGFFSRNQELGIDFRKNALIMNKTPVHTAKTDQLKYLLKHGSQEVVDLIHESQKKCAGLIADLHAGLLKGAEDYETEVWLVGYSELRKNGIFQDFKETFRNSYNEQNWQHVMVFQHFSMNCFTKDLKEFTLRNPNVPLRESLSLIGRLHREEIFQ